MLSPEYKSTVIIDGDASSIRHMEDYINSRGNHVRIAGAATSFEAGLDLIEKERPRLVIMEIGADVEGSLEGMERILSAFPQVSIFATCADRSAETILRVMRGGADEYLPRPVSMEDLEAALQKHGRPRTAGAPENETGRVFTVFSPKGGVGVTTTAINLAAGIHAATKKPTILVDLDLSAGDASVFLDLKPSYTISDAAVNISRLDRSFLKGIVTQHASGIHVLAEPQKVQEAVSIMGGDVKRVLELLKTMFDYIVVDTETVLGERTMATFEMSDVLLMVLVLSLPGIRNMQRYLQYIKDTGFKDDKVKLVVNRYLKKGDIRLEDAEKVLGRKVFHSIPNEYGAVTGSLNKGVPLCVSSPKSPVNISINDLSKAVIKVTSNGGSTWNTG